MKIYYKVDGACSVTPCPYGTRPPQKYYKGETAIASQACINCDDYIGHGEEYGSRYIICNADKRGDYMNKEMALAIIKDMSQDQLADYIIELYECLKKKSIRYNIPFLLEEFSCKRWYEEAEEEVGESGTNFMYFVAGFKCRDGIG